MDYLLCVQSTHSAGIGMEMGPRQKGASFPSSDKPDHESEGASGESPLCALVEGQTPESSPLLCQVSGLAGSEALLFLVVTGAACSPLQR